MDRCKQGNAVMLCFRMEVNQEGDEGSLRQGLSRDGLARLAKPTQKLKGWEVPMQGSLKT